MLDLLIDYKQLFTILHLLGVVVGFGAAIVADFLFFRFVSNLKLSNSEIHVMGLVSKLVWVGLALISLSGLALYLSAPDLYASSSKFLVKMLVVAVISLNGGFLHFYIKPRLKIIDWQSKAPNSGRKVRKLAFMAGAISFNSWLLALVLGSMESIPFSFSTATLAYLGFLGFLIVGSQVAEYACSILFVKNK